MNRKVSDQILVTTLEAPIKIALFKGSDTFREDFAFFEVQPLSNAVSVSPEEKPPHPSDTDNNPHPTSESILVFASQPPQGDINYQLFLMGAQVIITVPEAQLGAALSHIGGAYKAAIAAEGDHQ